MGDLFQFKEVPEGYEPKDGDEVLVSGVLLEKPCGEFHIKFAHADVNLFAPLMDIIAIRERPIEEGCTVCAKPLFGEWRAVVRNPENGSWWIVVADNRADIPGHWMEPHLLERV